MVMMFALGIIAAITPAAATPHTTKASTETLKARNAHILALAYLCAVTDTTVTRIFVGTLHLQAFMRPMTWATMKVVFDLSGGHYFLAFRTLHIVSVVVLMFAFVRLTRVEDMLSLCAALVAMAALMGMPAFHDTMNETELNTKLTLAAISLVVVNLSAGSERTRPTRSEKTRATRSEKTRRTRVGRILPDAATLVLLVWALLTNELGLLLWVCVAAAYLVGFRGVSRNAVIAATALLAIYFYVRFLQLHVGTPALNERSSGFGFRIRSPGELIEMFGNNHLLFYAYNIAASVLSVLFSEPRAGVFAFTRDLTMSKVQSGAVVAVVTSCVSTALMIWFAAQRWRHWVRWELRYEDQIFLLSSAVVVANAVISFPYVKDVIMNIASIFYCLALCMTLRELMAVIDGRRMALERAALACALLMLISIGWTIRAASFYADMRLRAYKAQVDWVFVDQWLRDQHVGLNTPGQRRLVEQLSTQMIAMRVPKVYLEPRWVKDLLTPD